MRRTSPRPCQPHRLPRGCRRCCSRRRAPRAAPACSPEPPRASHERQLVHAQHHRRPLSITDLCFVDAAARVARRRQHHGPLHRRRRAPDWLAQHPYVGRQRLRRGRLRRRTTTGRSSAPTAWSPTPGTGGSLWSRQLTPAEYGRRRSPASAFADGLHGVIVGDRRHRSSAPPTAASSGLVEDSGHDDRTQRRRLRRAPATAVAVGVGGAVAPHHRRRRHLATSVDSGTTGAAPRRQLRRRLARVGGRHAPA